MSLRFLEEVDILVIELLCVGFSGGGSSTEGVSNVTGCSGSKVFVDFFDGVSFSGSST